MGLYYSTPKETTKYGWVRDLPDHRYRIFVNKIDEEKISDKHEINLIVPVYNQGHLGSCTTNAIGVAFEHDEK